MARGIPNPPQTVFNIRHLIWAERRPLPPPVAYQNSELVPVRRHKPKRHVRMPKLGNKIVKVGDELRPCLFRSACRRAPNPPAAGFKLRHPIGSECRPLLPPVAHQAPERVPVHGNKICRHVRMPELGNELVKVGDEFSPCLCRCACRLAPNPPGTAFKLCNLIVSELRPSIPLFCSPGSRDGTRPRTQTSSAHSHVRSQKRTHQGG